jgi:hypothetical protein
MRKATVALLVVLLIASFGVFADGFGGPMPGALTDCITVNATIPSINWLWIAPCCGQGNGPSMTNNWDCGDHCEQVYVNHGGTQNLNLCLYALSNNRCGYTISMKAKALKSVLPGFDDAFINFTATCGGAVAATADDAWCFAPGYVEELAELHYLQITTNAIGLYVNPMEYIMAVSGQYTGKVVFTFCAN